MLTRRQLLVGVAAAPLLALPSPAYTAEAPYLHAWALQVVAGQMQLSILRNFDECRGQSIGWGVNKRIDYWSRKPDLVKALAAELPAIFAKAEKTIREEDDHLWFENRLGATVGVILVQELGITPYHESTAAHALEHLVPPHWRN